MKTKIYKSITILSVAFFMLIFASSLQSHAQVTTIYSQNFNTAYPNWPAGWSATGDSTWFMDTSSSNQSYIPTPGMFGYPGASGGAMAEISNLVTGSSHYDTLYSDTFSTLGYSNITLSYGARRTKHFSDNGSKIQNLSWSSDGITWDSLAFLENPNDSYWHLINDSTPIDLPAGANNQAHIQFRWSAYLVATASGTYRIDDINVDGTVSTGINILNGLALPTIFPNPASDFTIINNPEGKDYTLRLVDVTGKVLKTITSSDIKSKLDLSGVESGFYFAQITGNDNQQVQVIKLVVIH